MDFNLNRNIKHQAGDTVRNHSTSLKWVMDTEEKLRYNLSRNRNLPDTQKAPSLRASLSTMAVSVDNTSLSPKDSLAVLVDNTSLNPKDNTEVSVGNTRVNPKDSLEVLVDSTKHKNKFKRAVAEDKCSLKPKKVQVDTDS